MNEFYLHKDEIKKGLIYAYTYGGYYVILRPEENTDYADIAIRKDTKQFWTNGVFVNGSKYRPATQEEINHLLACEKAGKYVELINNYQIY